MARKMSTRFDQFQQMVRHSEYLVLDTETTGLRSGEICSIAIINNKGEVLLDTFVKTVNPIPESATEIHGITDAKVALSPYWSQVAFKVSEIIQSKNVVIYNLDYDLRMMYQSDEGFGVAGYKWHQMAQWFCAMQNYAEFYGDWNDWRKSYRWQRLGEAVVQQGLVIGNAHAALGDCKMTLELCKIMAQDDYTERDAATEGIAEDNEH